MDSSECPLSKNVSPLCERKNHQLTRSIRSDLETTVLKWRFSTPGTDPTSYNTSSLSNIGAGGVGTVSEVMKNMKHEELSVILAILICMLRRPENSSYDGIKFDHSVPSNSIHVQFLTCYIYSIRPIYNLLVCELSSHGESGCEGVYLILWKSYSPYFAGLLNASYRNENTSTYSRWTSGKLVWTLGIALWRSMLYAFATLFMSSRQPSCPVLPKTVICAGRHPMGGNPNTIIRRAPPSYNFCMHPTF